MGMALSDDMLRTKTKEANRKKLQAYDKLQTDLRKLVVKYEIEDQSLIKSSLTNVINDLKNLLDGRGE